MNTSVRLCGVELKNPILTASGTFGFGREYSEFYDVGRLGGIVGKGLTPLPREGNDWSYKYARRQWHLVDDPTLRYSQLNEFDKAMITVIATLRNPEYSFVRIDEECKLISYVRDDKLFAFNFSTDSYAGCRLNAPCRDYRIILSTDDKQFGGFGRIDTNMVYSGQQGKDGGYVDLYLPSRTAVVLASSYLDLSSSPWRK